jgi:DGQHR domain-containing protein
MAKKRTTAEKSPRPKPAKSITLPMLPLLQAGYRMYAFVAQSDMLRKIVTFSRRVDDKEKGFQRHFKESRLRSIKRYIEEQHGPIPNNIILDFDENAVTVDESAGTITLPTEEECALVIDGQHRLLGFENAKTQYPLLVLGFVGLDLKQKVNVFVTINTEQKRLSTSLCLDLLNIVGSEEDVETRCRDLVGLLNEEEDSPWYGQIDMTGEVGGKLISLVNFVRKLKPLLTGVGFMKAKDITEQYKILANYWRGIRAVYADQWGGSLLTKTLGLGALMNVLPELYPKTMAMNGGLFNTTAVIKTFKYIKDLQFDSDTFGSGSGNKAEMRAADILTEKIENAISMADGSNGAASYLDD